MPLESRALLKAQLDTELNDARTVLRRVQISKISAGNAERESVEARYIVLSVVEGVQEFGAKPGLISFAAEVFSDRKIHVAGRTLAKLGHPLRRIPKGPERSRRRVGIWVNPAIRGSVGRHRVTH